MSIYLLKSRFQSLLRPIVAWLYRLGVTANQVTVAACVASIGIGVLLIFRSGEPILFLIVPIWMFVRMALNAIDGMLAREFGQASLLGAYLNELTDVVSDAALYLPFALVAPLSPWPVFAVIFTAALSEFAGVLGAANGLSRHYEGPMGKSDRAVVFGALGLWIGLSQDLAPWANTLLWVVAGLALVTAANRTRAGLRELHERRGG